MERILICGANGMVGSNLVESAPPQYELLTPDISELDLLDYNKTLEYLNSHNPDFIIHAAGIVGGIQANIAQPVKFLIENTDMGRNIVCAAHNAGIKRLLNLGSSCMYPRYAKNPLREELVLSGELEPTNEGYALAKIFTQRLCSYINRQYPEFAYKTVIPCNLYGKYDKFEAEKSHMIPAAIRKIHEAKTASIPTVEIWGDGSARREFMYAKDLATIIWRSVGDFDKMPELMNLGIGKDYTIKEYYEAVKEVIEYSGSFVYDTSKPVGMQQKLVDNSKQTEMGLLPRYSLTEGIRETYEYFLTLINTEQ